MSDSPALSAEPAQEPEGSPHAAALLAEMGALATWPDFDRTLCEWSDVERAQFRLIFQALDLDPVTAIQLGSAWAQAVHDEPTDFRKLWGDSFAENDALFRSFASRIPAVVRDKWTTPTIRRRPAFVVEALKIAWSRTR